MGVEDAQVSGFGVFNWLSTDEREDFIMTSEKKGSSLSRGEIEDIFKALRLDGLMRGEKDRSRPATDDFGVLRHVPVTADNVTTPPGENSGNA